MKPRNKQYAEDDDLLNLISGLFVFYIVYLILLWFTDRANFWRWVLYGLGIVIMLLVGIFAWQKIKKKRNQKKKDYIINTVLKAGLEEYIKNFISRFGLGQEKSTKNWKRRNYSIDWNRIRDLQDFLSQKEIKFSLSDISILLSHYIDKREYDVTFNSINVTTGSLAKLSGDDFEKLLYRLYESMDYSVQLNGKTGDQGGDLIITKGQERILIQAKRYLSAVSNSAVQQAVAAKNHYDCNKATVVTTGYFTKSATELAKTNNVELISLPVLQKMLLDNLKESWN